MPTFEVKDAFWPASVAQQLLLREVSDTGRLAIRGGPGMNLRICRTPGCTFQILGRRHRHCCSLCNSLDPTRHGERCLALQRLLEGAGPAAWTPGICQTEQCGREANWGYRSCCSTCFRTGGQRHSARCQEHLRTGTAGGFSGRYRGAAGLTADGEGATSSNTVRRGHHLATQPTSTEESASSSSSRAIFRGARYDETNIAEVVIDLLSDEEFPIQDGATASGNNAGAGAVQSAVTEASLLSSSLVELDEMD